MSEITSVYTIWLREIKRFIRAKPRILGNLIQPIIWFAIMGVGLNSSFRSPNANFNYLNFMTPGIIGMTILFTSTFSGISVIWERQFGFLKEILVSPASRISIVIGKVLGSSTISLISALIFLAVALVFGGISANSLSAISLLKAVGFMILISVTFVSIGLIIASVLNNMEGFQVLINLLILPLFFLSGAFFPLQNAPAWMDILAHGDPLMYGVDGLRGAFLGISQQSPLTDFAVITGFSLVLLGVATFAFRRIQ